jgi:hypothetical protein
VPLHNHVKINGPEIAKVLEPGERLLALGIYRGPLNPDTRGLERADDELSEFEQRHLREHGERLPRSDKVFELGQFNTDMFNNLMSGTAGSGAADSYAGLMWRAGKAMGPGIVHWAVTDRRFLLIQRPPAGTSGPWTIGFAVPRAAVRSARRHFKILFGWGQVEVTFADGSMLAILAGLIDVGLANQMIRALTGGGTGGDR